MTSTKRPYTGIRVKPAKGKQAGLEYLVRALVKYSDGTLKNLGTYQIRNMRGKSFVSVHARGTAADLGFSNREKAVYWMDLLVKYADELGVEAVFDYFPAPHGRGWKCDRNAWQKYTKKAFDGAPNGRWFHVEVSVAAGKDEPAMKAAFHAMLKAEKDSTTAEG
jgi:hypothetical protein